MTRYVPDGAASEVQLTGLAAALDSDDWPICATAVLCRRDPVYPRPRGHVTRRVQEGASILIQAMLVPQRTVHAIPKRLDITWLHRDSYGCGTAGFSSFQTGAKST